MPRKYHIDVSSAAGRYPTIGKSGIVDWGEGCLKCAVCVKHECVYDVYHKRSFSVDILGDTIDEFCKNCFRCVQGCPKRLIHKTVNPEWESLGDDVYSPEIITATWLQAETGKIPVSGAGYGGPFSGPGFDSMWTDMSEIVRPTRDGIHGREYISTVVEIGRRLPRLEFDGNGGILSELKPSIRIPLPIIFDVPPFGDLSSAVRKAMASAASRIGSRMVIPRAVVQGLEEFKSVFIPLLDDAPCDPEWLAGLDIVEIADSPDARSRIDSLKISNPRLVVVVRLPALSSAAARSVELAKAGAEAIHLAADARGYEPGIGRGLHLKDVVKDVHDSLVREGLRDEITFVVSGGIAMAEHVVKAMLCGANLVAVDVPLLIALECRVCRNCTEGGDCPVRMAGIDPKWGSNRIVNLMGAWHNQLLEMMGAMGIREARRLRGERGRVMFIEDLEAETFGQIFGRPN